MISTQTSLEEFVLMSLPQPAPDRSTLCDLCADLRDTQSLERKNRELEERVERLEAFAHTTAHQIKSSLGPMLGFAMVLRDEYARLTAQEQQMCLDNLVRDTNKLNAIVDELLLLAQMRGTDVTIEPLCMAVIVAEALARLAAMIHEHKAVIVLPASWPMAIGHGPWVEEVWVNYISNAIKYGGRPPRVELNAATQADGSVCFWVRDNGDGIPLDDQPKLFKPLSRLGRGRVEGHGLGLAVVRQIAEKLNGEVGVESVLGHGSLFSFTLPGVRDGLEAETG